MIIASLAVSAIFTYLSKPIAIWLRIVDAPGDLKVHKTPVPRFGGLGIFAGVATGVLMLPSQFHAILVGLAIIWIVGAIDDRWTIGSYQKLGGQALSGLVLWFLVFRADPSGSGLMYGALGFLLAVLYSNAVNLIDGMNGLAGGNVFLVAVGIGLLQIAHGQYAAFPLIVAAATLGFLPFNFPSARVFMGDSGSLLLGYLIAYILIQLLYAGPTLFVCGLIIAMLPVFDVVLGILRRFLNGRPIFAADRYHFYDRINILTRSTVITVLITYAITIGLSIVAIGLSFASQPVALAGLAIIAVVSLVLSRSLGWFRATGATC